MLLFRVATWPLRVLLGSAWLAFKLTLGFVLMWALIAGGLYVAWQVFEWQ